MSINMSLLCIYFLQEISASCGTNFLLCITVREGLFNISFSTIGHFLPGNTMHFPLSFIKHPGKQQVMAMTNFWFNIISVIFIPHNLHIEWEYAFSYLEVFFSLFLLPSQEAQSQIQG